MFVSGILRGQFPLPSLSAANCKIAFLCYSCTLYFPGKNPSTPPSEKYNEIGVDARSDRLYMPPPAYIPCRYIRA